MVVRVRRFALRPVGDARILSTSIGTATVASSRSEQRPMPDTTILQTAQALANERRLQILAWLKDPVAHFPPQVDGDLVEDGVCVVLIADKLGVSQPTASEHLKVLAQAGLVRARRIKQWTFYRRDEGRIREIKEEIAALL